MNVSFRLCSLADIDIADAILMAGYKFTNSIKNMLSHYYFPIQPDGWWLAYVDDQPVGFGGAVNYGPFCLIGMLAVRPEWQNQGIGEQLVKRIIAWEQERACPSMVLESAQKAASLYTRLGFSKEDTTLRMVLDKPPVGFQPSAKVEYMHEDALDEVAAFDAPYFGANRVKVLRPHWQDNPERAFVTRNEAGEITGYLFARQRIIGPWVARTISDAEQLLTHTLSLPFTGSPEIWLPATNWEGVALLKRYGFSEQGRDHFMRKSAPFPGQRSMIYAQASPALG